MDTSGFLPIVASGDPASITPSYSEEMMKALAGPWTKLTLKGGATDFPPSAGYQSGVYVRRVGDNLQIRGMVKPVGTTAFANIPDVTPRLRPLYNGLLPAVFNGNAIGAIYIATQGAGAGDISVLFGAVTSYVHLNHFIPLT